MIQELKTPSGDTVLKIECPECKKVYEVYISRLRIDFSNYDVIADEKQRLEDKEKNHTCGGVQLDD